MTQRDPQALLQDIRDACDIVAECLMGLTRESYPKDRVRRSAVERQIEVMGEALRRLLEVRPSVSLEIHEAKEVIQFRNFLAHGYHLIDHDIVWQIASRDVPMLRSKVADLLVRGI